MASKQPIALENSTFLPASNLKQASSADGATRQSLEPMDSSCKVGNGVLCGNARLQEAWEPERKASPDAPWRYEASTTSLNLEPIKTEGPENVVLQMMTKTQSLEMNTTFQKKYFLNNPEFQQYKATKTTNPGRLDRELFQQRMERKAAAMERELRLQKSLSEECEDLGVDEPSTSDLFPEADLLFDSNHSPSFDHSSQDASCSQMARYSCNFRSQDSSSGSRDNSPSERRKGLVRTRTLKDTAKRAKREEGPKRAPLSCDESGDSRLSPGAKRNGSEEAAASGVKIEESNNVASSDESLTLLGGGGADVTIPSPLSPIAGPLLSTHKFTYSNKKRRGNKIARGYMAWDSPVSERTRSSSEDDDSSLGEASQNEEIASNGLEEKHKIQFLGKDKLQVNARVVLNRADASAIFGKHVKDEFQEEKMSDGSDDEHHHHHRHYAESVGSRRASLRGPVKKGYACCNGSPERPKKKAPPPVKLEHKLKKRLTGKPLGKKR